MHMCVIGASYTRTHPRTYTSVCVSVVTASQLLTAVVPLQSIGFDDRVACLNPNGHTRLLPLLCTRVGTLEGPSLAQKF